MGGDWDGCIIGFTCMPTGGLWLLIMDPVPLHAHAHSTGPVHVNVRLRGRVATLLVPNGTGALNCVGTST